MSRLREALWIWRDRVALALVIGVPLFAVALLSLTFSNAVIRDLRVDVVDQDKTQTSMTYVQALNSAPGVNVARRSTDLSEAMHAIRSGAALAAVYLRRDLERDIAAGKRPPDRHLLQKAVFYAPATSRPAAWPPRFRPAPPICRRRRRRAMHTGPLVVEQYVLTKIPP